jgi:hypothetical protein
MMSEDGGSSWSIPEMFTPDTTVPVLDWRWVSITPVNPVEDNNVTVHLVIVGDPIAGAFIYPPSPLLPTTAKFYHFSTNILLSDVEREPKSLSTFKLFQNYPNPFNPSTVIRYHLLVSSKVTLIVYDLLGNEIATLVNEEKTAGEYEVTFDVGTSRDLSLSSGIYFYTFRAGSFVETKKMVYLK